MELTRPDEAMEAARKVIKNSARYKEASLATGVPWQFIGVLDLRESDCDPRAALGQGDPWNQVSVNVPSGKGPFKSWADAAIYYIGYDHLTANVVRWDMPIVCWKGERWNGLGPRNHGIFTGYLWSGTNHYTKGKYVSDGVWNSETVDKQLGIIAVLYQMNKIDPANYIGDIDIIPSDDPPPDEPDATPFTLTGTMWVQSMLNILMPDDEDLLRVDGDYGRNTTAAVRNFQTRQGNLEVDGDAGELTCAAIDRELSKIKKP
jgi:lysozyme family protein